MRKTNYETHIVSNPLLPFLYHGLNPSNISKHCAPNWHENIEILVCCRGSAYFMLDGRQYLFQPGDICIANAYCVHTSIQENNLDYYCLIIDKKYCDANGIYSSEIRFREWFRDPQALESFYKIAEAYAAYNPEDPFCIADIRYAVLGLLRVLCRKHIINASEVPRRSASRERVKQAIEFINANFTGSISLQDVANHVGVSKFYLSREFKDFTGSTVFDTLNMTRCAEAKRLIEGGATVSEAALSCGFENLSYFTRSFKKHLGEKPSCFCKKQSMK